MIDRARLLRFASANAVSIMLVTAMPAFGQVLPYTPSSASPMLQLIEGNTTLTFPITQINDGQRGATAINGFATQSKTGEITFTFAQPVDLTGVDIWNNVVVDNIGGITKFTLEYYGSGGNSLGQSTHTAVSNQAAPLHIATSMSNVAKVVMRVADAQDRIEIRELEFTGSIAKPASFTRSCDEVKRLGFQVKTTTVVHSAAVDRKAIEIPPSYALGPLRQYNVGGIDRVFIDSYPLIIGRGLMVCEAVVHVEGSSGSVGNNDSVNVFLPKKGGLIYTGTGGWNLTVGTPLTPNKALTNNVPKWTYDLVISSANPTMTAPLVAATTTTGSPNTIDIFVQDDSVVSSSKVTYTTY